MVLQNHADGQTRVGQLLGPNLGDAQLVEGNLEGMREKRGLPSTVKVL
jgi:hypothetical protein